MNLVRDSQMNLVLRHFDRATFGHSDCWRVVGPEALDGSSGLETTT